MEVIKQYLPWIQVTVSVLLIIAILLQNRGGGLGGVFGGDDSVYRTKRGVEKGLFAVTIVLAALFLALSAVSLFIR